MSKISVACVISAVLLLCGTASASPVGLVNNFQSGTTEGWFAGGLGRGSVPPFPPVVVPTGGPAGLGDQFLMITSVGGFGAGSRLVAINFSWGGDYLHSGIVGIAMDLNNLGATELAIRLLFENPLLGPPTDEAVSTAPVILAAGSGWVHAFFPINSASFTAVLGNVDAALSTATLMRIIHSTDADDADSVVGVLGVDNITAVPEPATAGMLLVGLIALAAQIRSRRPMTGAKSA